ncbi:MAG: D-alanine--D-alanine ligase A, partial [Bacilli bacterium]|nr:D-alanine--D-alanine ligase A [Bacilli bacterium]
CESYSRVDFFLTHDKQLYFNEINTAPGFNIDSIYSMMLMDKGYQYSELVNGLIKMALEKQR